MDTTLVSRRIALRSGHQVVMRALRPDDAPGLADAFDRLSASSRYRRFFAAKPRLSEEFLAYLTAVDHRDHEALIALAPGSGRLVGVARFIRLPEQPDQAEVAVTVVDAWQRRGVGTILLRELARRAAEEGIRLFVAEILADNRPMLTLARRLGDAEITGHGSTVSARIDLSGADGRAGIPSHDWRGLLRAAACGQYLILPGVLREWLGLPAKIIVTWLVPVSAVRDSFRQAASHDRDRRLAGRPGSRPRPRSTTG
jgi:RimJ/RimL family protein N-acetyltransferase